MPVHASIFIHTHIYIFFPNDLRNLYITTYLKCQISIEIYLTSAKYEPADRLFQLLTEL